MKKLIIFFSAIAAFLALGAASASASTVTRSFDNPTPAAGSPLVVSLAVDVVPPDSFYIIDEIFPAGWVVSSPGTGDTTQPGHIKWAVISGAVSTNLQYTLAIPGAASGVSNFSGEFAFDSTPTTPPLPQILGATSVNVQAAPIPPVLTSITVAPAAATVNVGATQQLTASPLDQNSAPFVGATVSWLSSNPAVATVSATGLVTGVTAGGPVTITASAQSGAITVTNSSSITVTVPPVLTSTVTRSFSSATPVIGSSLIVSLAVDIVPPDTAYIIDEIFPAGWVVSSPGTGDTTQAGHIKWAVISGAVSVVNQYTLTVPTTASGVNTFSGEFGFIPSAPTPVPILGATTVNVIVDPNAPVFTSIDLTPASAAALVGGTKQFTATALDQFGVAMVPQPAIIWTSSNNAIATVDGTGLATGVALGGPVTITASSGAISDTASLNVSTDIVAPVITIIGPNPASVNQGSSAYTDEGASASDDIDGNITNQIITTGLPISTNNTGSFTVTYTVSDAAGNTTVATRTVDVVAPAPPSQAPAAGGGGGGGGGGLNGGIFLGPLPGPTGQLTPQPGSGQVLGQATFPNGSLLKSASEPEVFFIENGQRRHVDSIEIFNARGFSWANVQTVDKAVLEAIPRGLSLSAGGQVLGEQNIPEGGLIRAIGGIDVYIVKYVGAKKFKRLILSPSVFNSYGHLKWSNVMNVDQSVVDSFTTSDLVRATGDPKVYKLYPSGDTGEKRWVKTSEAFVRMGFDWDAIYEINAVDRDSYVTGAPLE